MTHGEYVRLTGFLDRTTLALLSLMQGAKGWETKSGAAFAVVSRNSGQLLFPPHFIGCVSDEKLEKYARMASIVKPRQLMDNLDHLSSWQSRDPENGLWGGAVTMSPYEIFSMSGLTEHGDEGMVLAAGHAHYGDPLLLGLDTTARISSNPHWSTLRLLPGRLA